MNRPFRHFFLLMGILTSAAPALHASDELDHVSIYVNEHRVGTWRDGDEQVLHLDSLKDGDTITFRAHTDLGGLGTSTLEIQDNSGLNIDRLIDNGSTATEAQFDYVYDVKHINNKITKGAISLAVILNLGPEREVGPRTIAYIAPPKKP
jgi:hypothetical protein